MLKTYSEIASFLDKLHPFFFYKHLSGFDAPIADKNSIKRIKYNYHLKDGAINALIMWSLLKDNSISENYISKIVAYLSRILDITEASAYDVINNLQINNNYDDNLKDYFNNHWMLLEA